MSDQKRNKQTKLPTKDLNNSPKAPGITEEFNAREELKKCLIDPEKEIGAPPVVVEIGSIPTLHKGNISLTVGRLKSRKTFFTVGLISAVSTGGWGTITSTCSDSNILWFDTEQGQYDVRMMAQRCYRMGYGNIQAYSLRPYNPQQRIQLVETAIYDTAHLSLVVIDGVRDLLSKGINDEGEATSLLNHFLKWTSERNFHLNVVLHTNKGDNNPRGHIGTELQNKAECLFSIEKNSSNKDVSTVTSEYNRHKDFEPFSFTIDDTGIPVFTDAVVKSNPKQVTDPAKLDDQLHHDVLQAIFKEGPIKENYEGMKTKIKQAFSERGINFGLSKAQDYMKYYTNKKWINYDNKNKQYEYKPAIL